MLVRLSSEKRREERFKNTIEIHSVNKVRREMCFSSYENISYLPHPWKVLFYTSASNDHCSSSRHYRPPLLHIPSCCDGSSASAAAFSSKHVQSSSSSVVLIDDKMHLHLTILLATSSTTQAISISIILCRPHQALHLWQQTFRIPSCAAKWRYRDDNDDSDGYLTVILLWEW